MGRIEPIGYVDDDVFEATRCFTGWTFDSRTGLFSYRNDWHDIFQKNFLGEYIPPNQYIDDGRKVLDSGGRPPGNGPPHLAQAVPALHCG